jgi:lipopolysaccharide transport system ATP-binding protein
VKQGEALGIIGRNGAGKSTLLKILTRITDPTSGQATLHGRVGSLLEVGTGFHPELTGRENVYLNGTILGMKKKEIDRKFDEIVDFSGVEKFIDTPVKRYSSGMRVRLAFAVAAHLDPEILIVDEVLAVGDVEFQRKCLSKMGDVAKTGRTVLFVSHNMAAMECLCLKGFTLVNGKLVFGGTAREAIDYYLHQIHGGARTCRSDVVDLSKAAGRRGECPPLLQRLEFFTDGGRPVGGSLKMGASLKVRIYFRLKNPTATIDASLGFDNLHGQRVFSAHSIYQPNRPRGKWTGDRNFVCEIPSLTLVPGEYAIKVALEIDNAVADVVEDAARLLIVECDYYGTGKGPPMGMFVLKHHWNLT